MKGADSSPVSGWDSVFTLMRPDVLRVISRAPRAIGVYLMLDAGGRVLYVGKAKSLFNRLKSYSRPSRDERPSVLALVPKVYAVEWILTESEEDALLLENSLIKEHRPRYNIFLKDDKSYAGLRLTKDEFPALFVTRRVRHEGGTFFGPYASASELRETLRLMERLFLLRGCSNSFFRNRSRPCLKYQIRRCCAPCVGLVTNEQYARKVREAVLFLKGEKDVLLAHLKGSMAESSRNLRYEEAAAHRDRINAVEATLKPQAAAPLGKDGDVDAVGLFGDGDASLLVFLRIRRGRMAGAGEYFVAEPLTAALEILRAFIHKHYVSRDTPDEDLPSRILLPRVLKDAVAFERLIRAARGSAVRLSRPLRGWALGILRLAERNAEASFAERKRRSEQNRDLLEEVKRRLRLPAIPRRIEGYDVSNLGAAEPVGSRVVFVDGEPDRASYRHYRVRGVKGQDDFAMLEEVVRRRFLRLSEADRPDLILVDGGRGQLRRVREALAEQGFQDIAVAAIAKEKEQRVMGRRKKSPERIFLTGQKNPLVFPPSSRLLGLLVRVRDEAHRFGVTFHRRSRIRTALRSSLLLVPGVGGKRMAALLRSLGSAGKVREAGLEELCAVPGMNAKTAEAVWRFFRDYPAAGKGK